MTQASHPNRAILQEADSNRLWFHARKTRPIWAKRLDQPQQVQTIEGLETVPAGTFLCRGEAGDIWPQSPERLADKYQAVGETDSEGWQQYVPGPDNQGVMAAQIPHPFVVQATWGELRGKPGDFLIKNYEDRLVTCPADVWIVDQRLFAATYDSTRNEAHE
jgi:hypothetical protein